MVVNIYLDIQTNMKFDALSRKYQVSRSTIAENVLFYLTKYLLQENKKELIKKIGKEYLYSGGRKTSIKPKTNPTNNENAPMYDSYSKAYTNAIMMYLHKHIKEHLTNENLQKFNNDLNTKLQKIKEPNWDYNHFIRNQKRYERNNG